MRILKVVMMAAVLVVAESAMAGTLYETATIRSVDSSKNTITVEFEKTGMTKTYEFPDKIGFVDEGVELVDKAVFKPGQPVKLELEVEKPKVNYYGNKTRIDYTLKSITVK